MSISEELARDALYGGDPVLFADVVCGRDFSLSVGSELLSESLRLGLFDPAEVLLSAGVSTTLATSRQSSPLEYCGDVDTLDLMLTVGADPDFVMFSGGRGSGEEPLQICLCHGADPDRLCAEFLEGRWGFCSAAMGLKDGFESILQSGVSRECVARVFWDALHKVHVDVSESVLGLDGVIDRATADLCSQELGMRFESLGSLVGFLNDPHLDLLRLTPRLVDHLRELLWLACDARRRSLVEALVISGATLPRSFSSRSHRLAPATAGMPRPVAPVRTPLRAGCFSRGDECEMVSLLLCSDPCVGAPKHSSVMDSLKKATHETGDVGPAELLMMCGLASGNPHDLVGSFAFSEKLLELLLNLTIIPDVVLTWAMGIAVKRRLSRCLDLVLTNCDDLSQTQQYSRSANIPLLHARLPDSLEVTSWVRLMAQCGVDLEPLLVDQSRFFVSKRNGAATWGDTVAHNAESQVNDTETISWPILSQSH